MKSHTPHPVIPVNQLKPGMYVIAIISQTGANPFDCSDAVNATQLRFGELSRPQQVMGIGYLYVERALERRRSGVPEAFAKGWAPRWGIDLFNACNLRFKR